jgi:hypothetical protein
MLYGHLTSSRQIYNKFIKKSIAISLVEKGETFLSAIIARLADVVREMQQEII